MTTFVDYPDHGMVAYPDYADMLLDMSASGLPDRTTPIPDVMWFRSPEIMLPPRAAQIVGVAV